MAELNDQNGQPAGQALPDPDEVRVRAQNAQRLARRRQAAALALEVNRTQGEDLDRFGERRQVGGTFENLQAVPNRIPDSTPGLNLDDIRRFLEVASFQERSETLSTNQFLTNFGGFVMGLNR